MFIKNSEQCGKSELDLFAVHPTQIVVEDGVFDNIKPHPYFKTGTVTFDIAGDSSSYINLSETELWVQLQFFNKNNNEPKPITDFSTIGPVNNFLHSLFSQVQVYLNNQEVENTNSNYPYRAYFDNLLCYGRESKETFLETEMFIKDEAVNMNSHFLAARTATSSLAEVKDKDLNKGLLARNSRFANQSVVELKGRLHSDIFNINKYLLPNINIQIKLTRSKPEFCLIGTNSDAFVMIQDCFLRVRRQKVSHSAMLEHAIALEKTAAKYPVKRVLLKNISIPFSASKTTITGIHHGILPSRVVLGFLETRAYDGDLKNNPFNFQNFGVKSLKLKVASRALPYSAGLELHYAGDCYLQGYSTLFQGIRESPNDITYSDYKNGYALYAFDLSPDGCNCEHFNLLRDGSLDLDVDFDKALKESITAIFYLEFDNVIEITKQHNIVFDYTI